MNTDPDFDVEAAAEEYLKAEFPPDPRIEFLVKAPTANLLNVLKDYTSPDIGISSTLFFIGMHEDFRKTQPEELFDLITAILRNRVITQLAKNRQEQQAAALA